MTLIPLVKKAIKIPLIAAGGIGSGPAMLAAIALGADGVQVGSRFVATPEASSHLNFKEEVLRSKQGSTVLTLKELTPVRMIKNPFYQKINTLYKSGADIDELKKTLGRGRAKKGMFEGDLIEGELEIGQVSAQINSIISAADILKEFIESYNTTLSSLTKMYAFK
jgi:enoyl-[acyl-carrier protein] reductase II